MMSGLSGMSGVNFFKQNSDIASSIIMKNSI